MTAPLVRVEGLVKNYEVREGLWGKRRLLRAVDGVDFSVGRGEILGLVGESGSGKTTIGRAVLRLIEADAGSIFFDGSNVRELDAASLRRLRRRMQIVFQDPAAALNPRMTVLQLVGEPLLIHGLATRRSLAENVVPLLEEVGLDTGALSRYPREFSGGQRQRIGIARALALRPDFVVCDEPVSSLDVSVRAQIVNLLADLQARHGMAYLFIAHDLAIVGHLADRIAVLYLGRVVEIGPSARVATDPCHPYSRTLFASSPPPDPEQARARRFPVAGEIPSAIDRPQGCAYHPRCPLAVDVCRAEDPPLRTIEPGLEVACHRAEEARSLEFRATLGPPGPFNPVDDERGPRGPALR